MNNQFLIERGARCGFKSGSIGLHIRMIGDFKSPLYVVVQVQCVTAPHPPTTLIRYKWQLGENGLIA